MCGVVVKLLVYKLVCVGLLLNYWFTSLCVCESEQPRLFFFLLLKKESIKYIFHQLSTIFREQKFT